MNELQIFNNPEFGEIRAIEINGEAWVVARDVALALGYAKPWNAIDKHVDKDDIIQRGIPDSRNNQQKSNFINQTGVVSLILGSELPSAKKFKRWITREVIPSILKTGSYQFPQLTTNELVLKIAQTNVELEREVNALKESQTIIEQKLDSAVKIFATSDRTWKESMEMLLSELLKISGMTSAKLRGFMYAELEAIAGVELQSRLIRRKTRMRNNGASYKECQTITKLDIISYDKKLRPIFEGIVKKYQARYMLQDIEIVDCVEGGDL